MYLFFSFIAGKSSSSSTEQAIYCYWKCKVELSPNTRYENGLSRLVTNNTDRLHKLGAVLPSVRIACELHVSRNGRRGQNIANIANAHNMKESLFPR